MVATELRTRIKNKIDDLSNWLSTNIVLLNGELAIVRLSGENDIRAKVGNGQDPFSELPYLNQSQLSSLSLEISSSTFLSEVAYQDGLAYQLGSQSDKLLQPAGNYLSTSVFEDQISSVKDSLSALSDYIDGISSEVSSLVGGSLSNYVPLSGDTLVSNDLSVGSNLYVNGEILSSIISAYAPKIIFRQYFEE